MTTVHRLDGDFNITDPNWPRLGPEKVIVSGVHATNPGSYPPMEAEGDLPLGWRFSRPVATAIYPPAGELKITVSSPETYTCQLRHNHVDGSPVTLHDIQTPQTDLTITIADGDWIHIFGGNGSGYGGDPFQIEFTRNL